MSSDLRATIKADFLRFDGLETVTYFHRLTEAPTFDSGVAVQALGTRGTNLTESMVARFAPGRSAQIWHVLMDDVTTSKPRDYLVDSHSVRWDVIYVEQQSLGVRARCHCVRTQS